MLELRAGDPRLIGSYRLVGRLGSGGMGTVFLARSAGGRLVAVKVIRDDLAEDPLFRARFQREVAAARRVSGLFTAPVVDADLDASVPFLVTAYIAGPSLADAVSRHGPWPAASVRALAAGLAESLGAIHSAGVVHRDLKPSNVLLAQDGPRVIDFGISRAAEESKATRTGRAFGSPGYMSPEQAEGGEVGPASDVFSLGAVLAFAAGGEGPFGTGPTAALVYRVVHSPPDLERVPAPVRPLIERCLAKDASQRPSPGELLADLDDTGVDEGWLPGPVIQDMPRTAPEAEISYSATQTAARHPALAGEDDADSPPAEPPGVAAAFGPPAPVRIRGRRSRSLGLGLVAAVALLAITGFGVYRLVSHGHGGRPPAALSRSVTALAKPKPHPSATPSPAAMVIKLTASQPCYVRLTDAADGSEIFQGVVPAGSSRTWTVEKVVTLTLGNPPGVVLTVNGKRRNLNADAPVTLSLSPPPA